MTSAASSTTDLEVCQQILRRDMGPLVEFLLPVPFARVSADSSEIHCVTLPLRCSIRFPMLLDASIRAPPYIFVCQMVEAALDLRQVFRHGRLTDF